MKAVLEQIHSPDNSSFAVFNFASRRFKCPYHYHPEVELTLIEAGRGQRLVGDNLSEFYPGDLVLLGSNLPHTYFHAPDFDDGPKGACSLVVQFPPDLAGGFFNAAPECRRIRDLLKDCNRGLVPGAKTRKKLLSLLSEMKKAAPLLRLNILLQILDILATDNKVQLLASAGYRADFNSRQAGRIERVCEWMTTHFREPLCLDDAARQAHLSPEAFSRFFHRATNRTFTCFLNELRIGHACRLLLESDKPIAEIAFASGYENLSHFNRQFLRLKRTTPRSYRQTARIAA